MIFINISRVIVWVLSISFLYVVAGFNPNGLVFAADSSHKSKSHQRQKRLKINPVTDNEDAWVANAETNIYQAGTFENLTASYSAQQGWDFSVSLLNTQVLGPNQQFVADTFFNIAKTFNIDQDLSITFGSQNGLALVNTQPQLWYSFSFVDSRYEVTPWLSIHAGPYLANAAITGTVRQVGFITGTEITFIDNQLSLQMDYLSGHHALSGATVNLLLNISPRIQVYLGVAVPEQHSGNEFAGIVGFNFSTKNL